MTTVETRRTAMLVAGVLAAGLAPGIAAPARAARVSDDVPPAIASVGRPGGPNLWHLAAGARLSFIRDAAYDPFDRHDVFSQLELSLTRVLGPAGATGGVLPAVGLAWEAGERAADARGTDARLSLRRLSAVLEGRWVPRRDAYVALRLSPGLLFTSASLGAAGAPAPLETSYVTLAADAAAGGGVRLTADSSMLGFWLVADAGYGWSPAHDLTLRPKLPDIDADKAGTTSLGSLSTRGPFMRFGIALSY